MWIGTIARVRGVIAASTAAGSTFSVRSSMSAKTGVARSCRITLADAMNEKLDVIDLVPRLEAEAVERDVEARRPARAGDGEARPDPVGERALERRHHLAARQRVRAQHVHHQLPLTLPDVGAGERDRPGRHHAAGQTAARTGYSSRSANRSSRPETIAKNVSCTAFVIGPRPPICWPSTDATGVTSAAVPHRKTSSAK